MIFYGAYTGIVGYELSVQAQQYSISAIWVESGSSSELNSIKIGAGVSYFSLSLCQFFLFHDIPSYLERWRKIFIT